MPEQTPPLDPRDVPIRPAATVMLVRDAADGGGGVEVFMMRRTTRAAFGAGMYVFPGGRVDGVDGADEIAPYCRGLDDATASDVLALVDLMRKTVEHDSGVRLEEEIVVWS